MMGESHDGLSLSSSSSFTMFLPRTQFCKMNVRGARIYEDYRDLFETYRSIVWIGVRTEGLRKRRKDYGSEGKIGEKEAAVIQQCHRAHRVGEINEMHFHAYFDTS